MDFENEIDVSTESSPVEIEQNNNEPSEQAEPVASSEPAPKPAEDNVPFHMHPRFQEVISQKNELAEQNKAFARQMQEMQQQLQRMQQPAPQAPQKDALLERLKGIDPEFAERFSKVNEVDDVKKELAELREFRQQIAARETQQQVMSMQDKFYSENNIPKERQAIYQALIQQEAAKDSNLKINDLPKVMKNVHDTLSKMFSTVERDTTKKFVEAKKTSAAKPSSQPKGSPVKPGSKEQGPMDRATARNETVKQIMAELKAGRDI